MSPPPASHADLMQRIGELERLLQERALQAEEEQLLAQSIMEQIVHGSALRDAALSWRVTPACGFSGDQVVAARAPQGDFYVMLLDAAGHGLASSLALLPALPVFYSMVQKALTPGEIVAEMNRKIRTTLGAHGLLAAVIARYSACGEQIQYWNGGIPSGLLLDRRGHVLMEMPPWHLPLGVLDDDEFDASCEIIDSAGMTALVLHSDGLLEAENAARTPFGKERLRQCLMGPTPEVLGRIFDSLERHRGGYPISDDVSVAVAQLGK